MKILIVRHGDPDYQTDSLTDKGKTEAKLLSSRLCSEKITALYCSPLGRAKLTAQPTLEKLGITAEYCDWLKEFYYAKVKLPYLDREKSCWDIMPEFLKDRNEIYNPDHWREVDFIKNSDVADAYDKVIYEFDKLLEHHGYQRNGNCYNAVNPNHDTIVLVCHFGIEALLVSHLIGSSPFSILQNTVALPTSVTTFYTEERKEGVASFRMCSFGDVSHLYINDEPASFAGRFCECFTDDTRH